MWPAIKHALLHTVTTYDEYRQSHASIARNVCIAVLIITGLIAAPAFLIAYSFHLNTSIEEMDSTSYIFIFNQAIAAGQDISISAAGLIAILLHRNTRPANGLAFTAAIPANAWRIFIFSATAIIVLYASYHKLSELYTDTYEMDSMKSKIYEWTLFAINYAINLTTASAAIFIYLRGIGQPYIPDQSAAFAATFFLLYCWGRAMAEFNTATADVVTKFFAIVLPNDLATLVFGNMISFAVSIFTILPAAAMVSSAHAPDIDIRLNEQV